MNRLGILIFLFALLFALLGVFILYESSTYNAALSIGDKYYFAKNQAIWCFLGVIACLIVSKINYKTYYKLALPLLLISIGLLILVFFPGIGLSLKGAHRWLNLGFTVIQPSEILKITMAIYLAAWLSVKEKGRFMAFMMLLGAAVILVIIEPDMGTAMIIGATATIMYFLSGAPMRDMALIALLVVVAVIGLIKLEPYRVVRFTDFAKFNADDLSTTSYQVKQGLISIGSGGLTGVGFGRSVQKYAYLPESTTDSIFAIFAEEGGFIFASLLIALFGVFIFLGFTISVNSPDAFGKLLGAGIITFIGLQGFVNLASQVVLMPLTGVPLPFISYGGSSLIINLVSVGILMNIASIHTQKAKAKIKVR